MYGEKIWTSNLRSVSWDSLQEETGLNQEQLREVISGLTPPKGPKGRDWDVKCKSLVSWLDGYKGVTLAKQIGRSAQRISQYRYAVLARLDDVLNAEEMDTGSSDALRKNLSIRSFNALRRHNVDSVPQFADKCQTNWTNVRRIRNLGPQSMKEVCTYCYDYNVANGIKCDMRCFAQLPAMKLPKGYKKYAVVYKEKDNIFTDYVVLRDGDSIREFSVWEHREVVAVTAM